MYNDEVRIFKALSDETRYSIVKLLSKKEYCACKIPGLIGKTQPNTSMHLAKLSALDIVKSRREGKMIIYSLNNNKIKKILKIIEESD